MQGHTTFAIPLGTGDLGTVQTTGAHDLDALGTQAHGVLHGAFHGAAEHDALFQLLGDGISDQLSIHLRLADFLDVDVHGHAQHLGQLDLQTLDVLALLADHDTRTSRVDGDACVLGRTLDQHAANRGVLQALLEELAHLQVFCKLAGEVFVTCIPTRSPVAADGKPESGRVNFLSHFLGPSSAQDFLPVPTVR